MISAGHEMREDERVGRVTVIFDCGLLGVRSQGCRTQCESESVRVGNFGKCGCYENKKSANS